MRLVIVLLNLLLSSALLGQNYSISTFAGNGTSGFSGDGSLAANAQLSVVPGVNLDSARRWG